MLKLGCKTTKLLISKWQHSRNGRIFPQLCSTVSITVFPTVTQISVIARWVVSSRCPSSDCGNTIHHFAKAFISTSGSVTEDYHSAGSRTLTTWKLTNSQQARPFTVLPVWENQQTETYTLHRQLVTQKGKETLPCSLTLQTLLKSRAEAWWKHADKFSSGCKVCDMGSIRREPATKIYSRHN